ncbi:unnamed protein product [Vitrella brassicaformis CCMP3155]|uniref:C2 tensin-type domain-containing protein n=3 Tax=Vitrella brassicaformis TaxID=1169539 RepID=A0A0G4FPH0_VITBC|nr:unnamed protein product [Vitrella brassicaformis CCMP3155]|eukprot:CEM16327.1 unnamed protein product [Vitrella brassicaformis CCMP3155]
MQSVMSYLKSVSDATQTSLANALAELDHPPPRPPRSPRGLMAIRPSLLVMEYPSAPLLGSLSQQLNERYRHSYLVINMSERKYDTSTFAGEVLEVQFRGLPSPPLGLMLELFMSITAWLTSDESNVVVVHCYKGFSRSAVFLSCFMAWCGLVSHPVDGLQEVCEKIGLDEEHQILPSQKRYLTYFYQIQNNFMPDYSRLCLRRVLLNGIPLIEAPPLRLQRHAQDRPAFRPYIEVWQAGQLLYSSLPDKQQTQQQQASDEQHPSAEQQAEGDAASGTAAPREGEESRHSAADAHAAECDLPWYFESDGTVALDIPAKLAVAGDILIRVRHMGSNGQKVSVLRAAFNTAFLPEGCLKLGLHELDGAAHDPRFPQDFFMDIILEKATSVDDPSESEDLQKLKGLFVAAREKAAAMREEFARRRSEDERREREPQMMAAADQESTTQQQQQQQPDAQPPPHRPRPPPSPGSTSSSTPPPAPAGAPDDRQPGSKWAFPPILSSFDTSKAVDRLHRLQEGVREGLKGAEERIRQGKEMAEHLSAHVHFPTFHLPQIGGQQQQQQQEPDQGDAREKEKRKLPSFGGEEVEEFSVSWDDEAAARAEPQTAGQPEQPEVPAAAETAEQEKRPAAAAAEHPSEATGEAPLLVPYGVGVEGASAGADASGVGGGGADEEEEVAWD